MDQHALARLKLSHVLERLAGGEIRHRQGGGGFEAESSRQRHEQGSGSRDVGAERATGNTHDTVADVQVMDADPDADDFAGTFTAQRSGCRRGRLRER